METLPYQLVAFKYCSSGPFGQRLVTADHAAASAFSTVSVRTGLSDPRLDKYR